MRVYVGQRFLPPYGTLTALPQASQTITPNYPGPYTFAPRRPMPPVQHPDVYGYEVWSGAGSTGTWTTLGAQILPSGYGTLDKLKIGCAILKQSGLSVGQDDPWVRGVLWHLGNRYDEFPNRLSVALQTCSQFGF